MKPAVTVCSVSMLALLSFGACTTTENSRLADPKDVVGPLLRQAVAADPDLTAAAEALSDGQCVHALSLLNVYIGDSQNREAFDLLLAISYACVGEPDKAAHHVLKSLSAADRKLQTESLRLAREVVASLGRSYLDRPLPPSALKALHQLTLAGDATWLDAGVIAGLVGFGELLISEGSYRQAEELLNSLTSRGVSARDTFGLEVSLLLRQGKDSDLRRLVASKAPELGPARASKLYAAAKVAEQYFRPVSAAWLYREAYGAGCREPDLWFNAGRAFLQTQQWPEADECLANYLKEKPAPARAAAVVAAARLLVDHGRVEQALSLLEHEAGKYGDDLAVVSEQVSLTRQIHGPAKASDVLYKHLETAGWTSDAVAAVAAAYIPGPNAELVSGALDRGLVQKKGGPHVRFYLALALACQGKDEQANQHFEGALADLGHPEPLYLAASATLIRSGRAEAAARLVQRGIAASPQAVGLWLAQADMLEASMRGVGDARLRELMSGSPPLPKDRVRIAAWQNSNGFFTKAEQTALAATADKDPLVRSSAWVLVGEARLGLGHVSSAVEALRNSFESAAPSVESVQRLVHVSRGRTDTAIMCVEAAAVASLGSKEALPVDLVFAGTIGGLTCGTVDPELLRRYLDWTPPQPVEPLLTSARTRSSVDVLTAALLSSKNSNIPVDTWSQLIVINRNLGLTKNISAIVDRYLSVTASGESLLSMGRTLVMAGDLANAERVLQASWSASGEKTRDKSGTLYSAVLFMRNDNSRALDIAMALVTGSEDGARIAAGLAAMCLDAGKTAEARSLALAGIRRPIPATKGGRTLHDEDLGEDFRETLDPQDLNRRLSVLESQSRRSGAGLEVRQRLVGITLMTCQADDKCIESVVKELLQAVGPWHGEPVVAERLARLGFTDQALPLYRRAVELAPGDYDSVIGLAQLITTNSSIKGDPPSLIESEIEKIFTAFIRARENDLDALKRAAEWLDDHGFRPLAQRLYEQLVKDGSADRVVVYMNASTLLYMGRVDEATSEFQKALVGTGCYVDLLEVVIDDYVRSSIPLSSLPIIEECVKRFPNKIDSHRNLARVLLTYGNTPELKARGLAEVRRVVKLDPTQAPVLASYLKTAGMENEVVLLLRDFAPQLDASAATALFELAAPFLTEAGRSSELPVLSELVLRKAGKNEVFVFTLASTMCDLGDHERCMSLMRKAADLGSAEAAEDLARRQIAEAPEGPGYTYFCDWVTKTLSTQVQSQGTLPEDSKRRLFSAGRKLRDAGRPDLELKLLEQARQHAPDDPDLLLATAASRVLVRPSEAGELLIELARKSEGSDFDLNELNAVILGLAANKGLPALLDALGELSAQHMTGALPVVLILTLGKSEGHPSMSGLADAVLASGQAEVEWLMACGQAFHMVGEYELAERVFVEALERNISDWEAASKALSGLCSAQSALGMRQKIPSTIQWVLVQSPGEGRFREAAADILFTHGFYSEALHMARLSAVTGDSGLFDPRTEFVIHLVTGRTDSAWRTGLSSAFASKSAVSSLVTFADLASKGLYPDLATDFVARVISMDPAFAELYLLGADVAMEAGRTEVAKAFISEFLKRSSMPDAIQLVTGACLNRGYLGFAVSIVESKPLDPVAAVSVGVELIKAGKVDKGLELARKALAADGHKAGRIILDSFTRRPYLLPGELRSSALSSTCSADSSLAVCVFYRGLEAVEKGDARKASLLFRDLDGNGTSFYRMSAFRSLVRAGHDDEALELLAFESALSGEEAVLMSAVNEVLSLLATESLNEGAINRALVVMEKLTARGRVLRPDDPSWLTQMGEALHLAGDIDKATQVYESLLSELPHTAGSFNNLAYYYARRNINLDRAEVLARRAIQIDPSAGVFYLDTLGWVIFQKGEPEKALEYISASLQLASKGYGPSLSEMFYHMAQGHQLAGSPKKAEMWYRRGSAIDPDGEYGFKCREELRRLGVDPYRLEETL